MTNKNNLSQEVTHDEIREMQEIAQVMQKLPTSVRQQFLHMAQGVLIVQNAMPEKATA